jgi:CheY-like chemotaxis protein
VPKTLLAVDDSATMRKALEITFGSDDFRVVTAENSANALALLREEPAAVVIDTALGSEDGYALARAVRARDARIAVVALASRYNPYDPARGREAGIDDFADKPFDTQALLDKVKKAIVTREGAKAAAPAPAPVTAPAPAAAPFASRVPVQSPPAPAVVSKAPWPAQRTHTLTFEGNLPAPPPPAGYGAPAAPPVSHVPHSPTMQQAPPPASRGPAPAGLPVVSPQPPPVAPAPPAAHAPSFEQPRPRAAASANLAPTAPPAAVETAVAAATNGQLAGKLGGLGLTPQQVDAVLALSREVVERVVWEVVPQLAEAIIKEEITRLTKEG